MGWFVTRTMHMHILLASTCNILASFTSHTHTYTHSHVVVMRCFSPRDFHLFLDSHQTRVKPQLSWGLIYGDDLTGIFFILTLKETGSIGKGWREGCCCCCCWINALKHQVILENNIFLFALSHAKRESERKKMGVRLWYVSFIVLLEVCSVTNLLHNRPEHLKMPQTNWSTQYTHTNTKEPIFASNLPVQKL